jgi:hypothetical protein
LAFRRLVCQPCSEMTVGGDAGMPDRNPGKHCYATAVASETVVMGAQGECGPQAPGPDQVRIRRGLLSGGPPALLPGENSALCMHNLWKEWGGWIQRERQAQ